MSQNVLTQRLRELEDSGVLVRRRALPPAAGLVYDLTRRGRDLEPVLLALGRWGSPLQPRPYSASELSPDALVVAMHTTFDPALAAGLHGTVRLDLPTDAFLLTVRDGSLDSARGMGLRTLSSQVLSARSRTWCSIGAPSSMPSEAAMLTPTVTPHS